MNAELNQVVLACVMNASATVNDYDQRSALGMARTWLENGKPITWNPAQVEYPLRDKLAKDLVVLIEDADPEDAVEALQDARAAVNAPFIDAGMARFRAGRNDLAKPGKNRKEREK